MLTDNLLQTATPTEMFDCFVTSIQQRCKVQRPLVGPVIHPVLQQIHNICCGSAADLL